jgi:hypothetical protein
LDIAPNLIAIARDTASRNGLDAAIVCAVVEQESAWDCRAMRYESAFRAKYVSPLGLSPTEEIARSISWGLMQVMGQVAREHGFTERFLSALCEPEAGIAVGCTVFAAKLALAERELSAESAHGGTAVRQCIAACKTATLGCVSVGAPPRPNHDMTINTTLASSSERLATVYRRALQLWNGGANAAYADQVLERVEHYR